MMQKTLAAILALSLAGAVLAQEETEEEGPWAGKLSLGYLSTSGNTATTSHKTHFEVGYTSDPWEHMLHGASNGADDGGATTAESYQLGWRSAYNFNENDFVFGTVDWRKDRFAGVVEQKSYALNYGRRVLHGPTHILALGIGAGYRDSDRADGTNEANAIGRGSLAYDWVWSETAGFEQDLIIESGSDNTYIESVSAVRARLVGDFALVLAYTIKQNTDVPVGTEKRDTQSSVSIEYAF
ncbi:MAG: DUF481 domain-containing protein [Gammaproteobacteria bacterium]|nr:DUF481 domain-containing protein [Gammaproteobacteria bacterium]MDH5344200.1 DUF481 domain-containing protein [Gammaproteobacteria bacterium]